MKTRHLSKKYTLSNPSYSMQFLNTLVKELSAVHISVMGLRGKVLVAGGGYRGGFCEKLLEASPMSDKASASRL